jgi:hypothetical protein
MKHSPNTTPENEPYNKAIRESYYLIYRKAKQLLATLEREELRFSLEREDRSAIKTNAILHELISPLLYLRLESDNAGLLAIHFGFEQVLAHNQYSELTASFMRLLYRHTATENTTMNIENCIKTDWMINTCSAMYEHIEERNKYHTFKQIPYKPATVKRKQLKAVA